MMYLDDIRWGPTLASLVEHLLIIRPKNVIPFIIELLANGSADIQADNLTEDDVVFEDRTVGKQDAGVAAAVNAQPAQKGEGARDQADGALPGYAGQLSGMSQMQETDQGNANKGKGRDVPEGTRPASEPEATVDVINPSKGLAVVELHPR